MFKPARHDKHDGSRTTPGRVGRESSRGKGLRQLVSVQELSACGVPANFLDARSRDYDRDPVIRRAVIKYQRLLVFYRQKGTGVFFSGSAGSMKSYLASTIVKRALQLRMTARFITVDDIASSYKKGPDARPDYFLHDIVVIDPLGSDEERVHDFVVKALNNFLLFRRTRNLPVVICSPYPLQAVDTHAEDYSIESVYGPAVSKSIYRSCVELRLPDIDLERAEL